MLDKRTEETKLYYESLTRSVRVSNKLVAQGTEEEIISSRKTMLKNANSLLGRKQAYLKAPVPVVKLSYTPCTRMEPLNEETEALIANCLGRVEGGNERNGKLSIVVN